MFRYTTIVALLLAAGSVGAESPSYNYVQVAYAQLVESDDIFGFETDGNGISIGGSVELGEYLFVAGRWGDVTTEVDLLVETVDLDSTTLGLSVGYRFPISPKTDFFATIGYLDYNLKYPAIQVIGEPAGEFDDDGLTASVGIRSMITDHWELNGGISYVDLVESDTSVALGAQYNFNKTVALGAEVGFSDSATAVGVGLRVYFGR